MKMDLGERPLLSTITINDDSSIHFINGKEVIAITDISYKDDSILFSMPVFESYFRLKVENDSLIHGNWTNLYKSEDYQLKVELVKKDLRYPLASSTYFKEGKYAVTFSPNSKDSSNAIGIFNIEEGKLLGTFATETGDYRYLEGGIINDSLFLSTFDGAHAFLFEAAIQNGKLSGMFYSGNHFKEPWLAERNESVGLRDPNQLTYIKEGYSSIDFSLYNTDKELLQLSDSIFDNKVKIVQIMGSWCPNCLDETNYFSELYQLRKEEGLEIVAVAFERTRSKEKAFNNLNRLKEKTKAGYHFVLGGWNREMTAEETFPMLNHVMSYPTAIFIDKKNKVRKIHTGFYGPGMGSYYENFKNETRLFLDTLLNE